MKRDNTERDGNICVLFKSGRTLISIGEQFGLCDERVRQIVRKAGLTVADGGKNILRARKLQTSGVGENDPFAKSLT